MTTSESLRDANSFGEFWEHYQELHTHPQTNAVHAVATASAFALLVLAVARRSWKLALVAPIADLAITRLSLGDRRHPRPLRRAWWHARAEWRMFRAAIHDAERKVHDRM